MTRFVVDVMPKREILDPQGKAVLGALPRLATGQTIRDRGRRRINSGAAGRGPHHGGDPAFQSGD
jgi:phosphoribosylformylglycinamidine synthase subunit PurS